MKASILGAVVAVALLATQQSFALGFGEAVLTSDMSSPLHLSVPVIGLAGSDIDPESLRVDVPGYLDQVDLGISDPVVPRGLKTVLIADGHGGVIVRMTTRFAVREPALRFALRARWFGGETVRTYELIVDPPFVARPRVRMQAPVRVQRASPRPRAAAVAPVAPDARAGTSYGPVTARDTLYEIALAAYPRLTGRLSRVMAVIVERNPNAFVGGDVNRLLRDTSVVLPATGVMVAAVAAVAAPSPAATTHGVPGSTYIVVEGDTLYGIARRVLAVADEQQLPGVVKRIHERNPRAFDGGNVNLLRVGAVLQLGAMSDLRADAAAVGTVAVAPTAANPPITAAQPALVDATVPALVEQLAAARQEVVDRQQAQSDLHARLDALARELQDLRVRSERLNAQSEALIGELQLDKADVTVSAPIAQSASADSGGSIPAATVTSAAPSAADSSSTRAPRPAPETGVLSFLGTVLPSGPMFWISAAVLILALLMATIAVVRRWWMVRDMQVRVRADEGAVRRKLEEVRKHHKTGSFPAQPLQAPGADDNSDSLHLTDAAHAVRFAREAAVNLAYGNFDVARTCIEEAIRLDPHRDEHKMVLVTVFENTGEHILAREIIDDLLNRRDQLSGDLRKQVEQMRRRSTD